MRRPLNLLPPIMLALLVTGFCLAGPSPAAADTYYSIHIASFSVFKNANAYVNSLSKAEKCVFWREVDIPGKGRFYRVFVGKYTTYDEARAAWESLNAEEKVSYQGIFKFASEDTVQNLPQTAVAGIDKDDAAAIAASPAPTPPPTTLPAPAGKRFIDNGDGTVTDTRHGLMWAKNGWPLAFFAASRWSDAVSKCSHLTLGGHKDWRLPSVQQWQTLIDPDEQAPSLPSPNPFENVIIHMPYWSNSEMSKYPVKAYAVLLYNGRIHQLSKDDRAFILPVRAIDAPR